MEPSDILNRLSEKFPPQAVKRLPRGGRAFDYVQTPDIIKRLNAVLGLDWDVSTDQIIPVSYPDRTEILKTVLPLLLQRYDDPVEAAERARRVADELMDVEGFIAVGELRIEGRRKGQVGFCDFTRSPEKDQRGAPLKDEKGRTLRYKRLENADTAVKGAASDLLKKCATLAGVALYLTDKSPEEKRAEMAKPQTRDVRGKADTRDQAQPPESAGPGDRTPGPPREPEQPPRAPSGPEGPPAQAGQMEAIRKLAKNKGLDQVSLEAECLKVTGGPVERLSQEGAKQLIAALNKLKR